MCLEPVTGDMFMAQFDDCHKDEFLVLGEELEKFLKRLYGVHSCCYTLAPYESKRAGNSRNCAFA